MCEDYDVGFKASASGGLEAVSPALVTVVLSEVQSVPTAVDYDVTGGTATPGVDFIFTPGTLTFNPGETAKNISIEIITDGLTEDTETIELTLSSPTGGNLGPIVQHIYSITPAGYRLSRLPPAKS